MTVQAWKIVMMVGAALVAVGLWIGLSPVKAAAVDGTQDCGSAFHKGDYELAGSLVQGECDSKRSDRRTWAIALLIAGGVGVVSAEEQLRPKRSAESSDPPSNVPS